MVVQNFAFLKIKIKKSPLKLVQTCLNLEKSSREIDSHYWNKYDAFLDVYIKKKLCRKHMLGYLLGFFFFFLELLLLG